MTTALVHKKSKERGSHELWLDAAYQTLVESGVDNVRIVPLSERLNLSRTSFYWFFPDRDALLAALLERWQQTNDVGLIAATEAYAESPAEASLNVLACFIKEEAFDPRFEFAVRSWALQSDDVMRRVSAADETRLEALRRMLGRFGYGTVEADVRARTIYLVQIGYISMQACETLQTRMTRVPDYAFIYTGTRATDRELARFHAQFGYVPGDAKPPPRPDPG